MYGLVIILLFLTKLRFPADRSVAETITRRYGRDTWLLVRQWENILKKWEKAKLDVTFLERCLTYNVYPKFVKFKLYKRSLHRRDFYKEWQRSLITNELQLKRKCVDKYRTELLHVYNDVKSVLFFIDFNHVLHFIHKNVDKYKNNISIVHAHKLYILGAFYKPPTVNTDVSITNLSQRSFSKREKWLLSFGLDHCFTPKLSKFKFSLSMESMFCKLSNHPIVRNLTQNDLIIDLKTLMNNTISFFKDSEKENHTLFTESDYKILKKLKKETNIIISKPDKGRGIVIMNKQDYVEKMNTILNDVSTFCKMRHSDPFKNNLLLEDKLNRFLKKMLDNNYIYEEEYRKLYASGSNPGIMYGLPKIHKTNIPLRPVLSSFKTHNYNAAKFLIPYIDKYAKNEYSLSNSYEFFTDLKSFRINKDNFIVSLDITSLYTNVPLRETIDILTTLVYDQDKESFRGMSKKEFKTLLELAIGDTYFVFDKEYYKQIDGLAMGSPLSATLANIFLCFHEKNWIHNCPADFKPIYYKRYVDDTFVIFRNREHAQNFLNYMNTRHDNISFTMELEENNQIPFLDILIKKTDNEIDTSIYRKPTYTGLGINYLSSCYENFKMNAFNTMFYRAFRLTSSYENFHNEIKFLERFFLENGFMMSIFSKSYEISLIRSSVHTLRNKAPINKLCI